MFKPVSSKIDFPKLEEEILKYWRDNQIFEESVSRRNGRKRFVFYEGPPTANGRPHMGHVLQRSLKDLFLRYKSMKGFLVERRAGWDTHGLPVEIEVEKELGLKGKQDILTLKDDEFRSIEYFNQKCKESVFRYVDDWVNLSRRIGFWIDFERAYVTYENDYMESVWWFISEINKKGWLYKDYKVVPYCPRCGSSLSSHELAQGYKDDVEDPSIYIKFELEKKPGTFLLVWTTTPWTLPGNVALAIGKNLHYVEVEQNGQKLILAKNRLSVLGEQKSYKFLRNVNSDELLGLSYKPLYNYLKPDKKAYYVTNADFASDEEGTGIVHTAVMYGVDDFELGKKFDLPKKHTVNNKGEFVEEVVKFAGKFVKDADPDIINDLQERGLLYKSGTTRHTYPFCWRCSTPLLYYALDSWFIKTTAVKEELIEDNNQIDWFPKTIKSGRMKNWLETLVDWNVSRNRFWGTPLPIWSCPNGHIKVVESKHKLAELGVKVPEDLHKPYIDQISLKCPECKEEMKRIPDVADVWMDSGAMPFAQWHFPFENQDTFNEWFPADYIVEGIDQTRGWFFTLMAEAMLLDKNSPAPFKNVISTGLVLDENGQKMSKSKGNVVSPVDMIPLTGADTLRWYIYTGAPAGSNYLFSKDILAEKHRKFMLILWNSYKFFLEYANLSSWRLDEQELSLISKLDKWVMAKLNKLISEINKKLDKYDFNSSSREIENFIVNDFSTWYIRRSRDRVGPEVDETDKNASLSVMYQVLVVLSKLLAPFTPFISEEIFRNLTGKESVHLEDYPEADESLIDKDLIKNMEVVRQLVEQGHAKRKEAGIKLRQPLAGVSYSSQQKLDEDLESILKNELNIKSVEYKKSTKNSLIENLDTNITPQLQKEGEARDLIRQIQQLRKEANLTLSDRTKITVPDWPKDFEEQILKSTASIEIEKGPQLKVDKV